MSDSPLDRAREHAEEIRVRAKQALDAHVYGDESTVRRHLRAVLAAHEKLEAAHDAIERAAETGEIDPIANPTGAQTSNGQSPRAVTPGEIRARDQLAGCKAGYDAKMRAMGVRR